MEATRLMTARAVAQKIQWEGGILGALEYGLRSDEIEDPELATLWRRLESLYDQIRTPMMATDRLLRGARRESP